eukprot:1194874-Prorocentrum_minimum.AAC.2
MDGTGFVEARPRRAQFARATEAATSGRIYSEYSRSGSVIGQRMFANRSESRRLADETASLARLVRRALTCGHMRAVAAGAQGRPGAVWRQWRRPHAGATTRLVAPTEGFRKILSSPPASRAVADAAAQVASYYYQGRGMKVG